MTTALVIRYCNGERRIEVTGAKVTIGRPKASTVVDLDLSPDMCVSRPHARLTKDEHGLWLEDLGSLSGTFLNGERLRPGERARLFERDEIRIGETVIVPTLNDAPSQRRYVFISHNTGDGNVRRVVEGLKRRGIDIWLAERNIPFGDPIASKISDGLSSTLAVVVLVGRCGISNWMRSEIDAAMSLAHLSPRPIIPVLLPGCRLGPTQLGSLLEGKSAVDLRLKLDAESLDRLASAIATATKGVQRAHDP